MVDTSKEDFNRNKENKPGIFTALRTNFFAGILVTAPIAITIYLTYLFITLIDKWVADLLPKEFYPRTTVPGLGLIIAVSFFVVVGWFTKNYFGRLLVRLSDYVMDKVPVIRTLYSGIKQIIETVMTSQSQAFREAVLLEYPRKGIWSIGFITSQSKGEVQRLIDADCINVFVPTTPNPTSGFLLFVPKKDITRLSMTVEEAVKLVISGGIISPPDRTAPEKDEE